MKTFKGTKGDKYYFTFNYFNELQKGDVFKFRPITKEHDISKFYTVCKKEEKTTIINATYGKELERQELDNSIYENRKVIIYPYRKR